MSATSAIQSQMRRSSAAVLWKYELARLRQVLGLADVDDASLGVLHQVEARRRGELLDLLGRKSVADGESDMPASRAPTRPTPSC